MMRSWICLVVSAVLVLAGLGNVRADVWIVDGVHLTAAAAGAVAGADASFPVLRLELGGQWTDFELKASTNNFQSLVYYIMSSGTNSCTSDTNVWVYFTDDYSADVRRWVTSEPGTAIGLQLVNPTNSVVPAAVVCPSHECAVDWREWMSATNNRLVWSFVRYDGIDLEKNFAGTNSRWSPVVPVEWRAARVAP